MTRYAILLSVEDYSSFPRTPFADADAALLGRTLVEFCDYAEQHVTCLHLKPGEEHTPSSILDEVKEVASRLQPGDTMLFFFAGHGHLQDEETFLVLPDSELDSIESTALPLRDLTAELRVAHCGCFRILDACHSGIDVRSGAGLDSQGFVDAVMRGLASGWVTLAACAENEFSVCDAEIGQGVFTHHLCEQIQATDEGKEILPEILKVEITPRVEEHALRIGNKQTPTFNASISGNLSLAVRRPHKEKLVEEDVAVSTPTLLERMTGLRAMKNILDEVNLKWLLHELSTQVERAIQADEFLKGAVEMEDPERAGSIPKQMHKTVVEFTRQQGLNVQHDHSRVEERVGNPLDMAYLLGTKRRKVNYDVGQSHSLPPSATIVQVPGDGRCVPRVTVLVYVIPLQICCCLLVAGFRHTWSPSDDSLKAVFNGFRVLGPKDDNNEISKLAHFSVRKIREGMEEHVAQRVQLLEKELGQGE